jgi:hypothetical protein
MRLLVSLAVLSLAAAARADDAPAQAPKVGTIAGKITIAGLAPKLAPLPVVKDNKICGVNKPDEALVIGTGGGIRNAVLWVPDVPPPKDASRSRATLTLSGCRIDPHVVVLPAGATLAITNADPVLHHPKAQQGEATAWSFPMPIRGYSVARRLDKPEQLKLSCEAHPWEKGAVVVLNAGAVAVSDEQGNYSIANVPAGKHKIKLWHERLGEREEEVDVPAAGTATRDITLSPR